MKPAMAWTLVGAGLIFMVLVLLLTRYQYTSNGMGGEYRLDRWTSKTVVCGSDGTCYGG
jgi:hypothetical protein